MSKNKKITSFSAVVLIAGSTIGAGIFFKNKWIGRAAQGELALILAAWAIAIFCIVAMGIALIEISSAQKSSRGTLEWTKTFTPRWFHHSSSKFMRFVLTPSVMFTMPIYIVSMFLDAGIPIKNGYVALLIAFAILLMYVVINITSFKLAEYAQWASKGIQLIPIIILPLFALMMPYDSETILNKPELSTFDGINGMSPWIVLISGIPAIAFSFDGFYTAASLRNDMVDPKKSGKVMMWGILTISLVYLFITIGFNIGTSDGTFGTLKIFDNNNASIKNVNAMFNILIAAGMMGIVNGFVMESTRQNKGQMDDNDAPDVAWMYNILINKMGLAKNRSNEDKKYFVTATYILILGTLYTWILGPIGISLYSTGNDWWFADYNAAMNVGSLVGFADMITSFTAIVIFSIIATAILGGIINRKTGKVEVEKNKYFLPAAWIAVVSMYSALIWVFVQQFSLIAGLNVSAADLEAIRLEGILSIIVLTAFLLLAIIPTVIEITTGKIDKAGNYVKDYCKAFNVPLHAPLEVVES